MAALPGPAGAIAAALLTGGQSGIPPAELQAMRDSGLAHLLSVSGLHIAIVLGLAFWLVRAGLALWPGFALRFGTKPWAALTGLAAGGFYMVLTGSQVPMQSSCDGGAGDGGAAGRAARHQPTAAGLRGGGGDGHAAGRHPRPFLPDELRRRAGLIAGFEAARPWLSGGAGPRPWWQRGLLVVAASLLTSLLAGAATTPFGLHHFGRLQLYGVAANAVAVPLTSLLVMPAGLLALFAMPLGLEAWPLRLMGWGVEGVLVVARGRGLAGLQRGGGADPGLGAGAGGARPVLALPVAHALALAESARHGGRPRDRPAGDAARCGDGGRWPALRAAIGRAAVPGAAARRLALHPRHLAALIRRGGRAALAARGRGGPHRLHRRRLHPA
jgi:predicted membrane metal-binding protein